MLACLGVVALGACITAIATAGGSGPVPAPKPLAVAVHDAITAPQVPGVSGDIVFTNHLVNAASFQGGDPLISGAHGRVWAGAGGRFRLELQSSRGDVQIVSDGTTVSLYHAAQQTLYRAKLPAKRDHSGAAEKPPTLAEVQSKLTETAKDALLSGADPSDVAGRAAYTVAVSPRRDGGLLDRAELAWDAANGVPLRVAVYATGDSSPVLELKVTNISFGSVNASTFDFSPPKGTKVVDLDSGGKADAAGKAQGHGAEAKPVTGVAAVDRAVPFSLAAPATLAGMPRDEVKLIDHGGDPAALVLYGKGLGGIAVLEQPASAAKAQAPSAPRRRHHRHDGPQGLPTVSIRGATAQKLETPLGTLIRFTRGGVAYTVVGSVRAATAEAAASGL
jgi:outer membrane lipoprotein-sorting protein